MACSCGLCGKSVGMAPNLHRVAGNAEDVFTYTTYVVTDPTEDSASGREEETIFFHKKFAHSANFL